MRLFHWMLLMYSQTAVVLASVGAGRYQLVFYYYAYRLQYLNTNPPKPTIGGGCVPEEAGRSCYFDEFVKWIQGVPSTSSTDIGKNFNPTVEAAYKELEGWSTVTDPYKLLPGKFTEKPNFTELMNPLMESIQSTREAMKTAGVDDSSSDEYKAMKEAWDSVVLQRKIEQFDPSKGMLAAFAKRYQDRGYSFPISYKDIEDAAGNVLYKELDTTKMLADAQAANAKASVVKFLTDFVTSYNTVVVKGKGVLAGGPAHFMAVQTATSISGQLKRALPCDEDPAVPRRRASRNDALELLDIERWSRTYDIRLRDVI